MKDNKEIKQHKGSPQETLLMIQCGNLDLSQLIQKGILLVGKTKAGKTTSAHYLTHQILESGYNDQNQLVYKLKSTNKQEYKNAKIGDYESVSETQIPNIFEIADENEGKFKIIDCPGYTDSFGCFRVTSNRFFHSQVFSKVKNAKFVVVFCYNDMLKRADNMRSAFKQFLKGFKNFNNIKQKLIAATAVIITSVPNQIDQQQLVRKYSATPDLGGQLGQVYKQLKAELLKNNRVFMFSAPTSTGQACNSQNKLLEQINKCTTFWSRGFGLSENEVDTTNININLLNYIDQQGEADFIDELGQLCDYYRKNVQTEISNLITVLGQFAKDNEADESIFKSIDLMIKFVSQKNQTRSKQKKTEELYRKYKNKREKAKNQIFKRIQIFSSSSAKISLADIPLWVSKMKILFKIQQLCHEFNKKYQINNYQDCIEAEKSVYNILSYLHELKGIKRQVKDDLQKKKNDSVLEFCYQIYKNIQISNKLYRLMGAGQESKKFNIDNQQKLKKGLDFIIRQYPTALEKFFINCIGEKQAGEIFLKKFTKANFNKNLSENSAKQVASFFQQVKQEILNNPDNNLKKQEAQQFSSSIQLQIIDLNNKAFQTLKKQANPSLKRLKQMEQKRKIIVERIQESNIKAQNSDRLQSQNNRIIQIMAECLYKNQEIQLALQLYDLLFDGHRVLQILEKDEDKIRKRKKQTDRINHLIRHSQKAMKYHRKQLAIMKAQQAFHFAQEAGNLPKTIEITKIIQTLCMPVEKEELLKQPFMLFLKQNIRYIALPRQLSEKILYLANSSK